MWSWAKATARFIQAHDPYRHLVTVHPVISSSTRGTTPRSLFDPPWRIGGFFGEGNEFDVLSQQTSAAYGAEWIRGSQQWHRACRTDSVGEWFTSVWDEKLNCWTGDVPGVGQSIAADRVYRKPVLNTEFGYEYLRGYPNENRQVHHPDKIRRTAWRIVCAGGYFATGFHGTIGHSDVWNRIDPNQHYGFKVRDEGVGTHMRVLYEFFNGLPFWQMHPLAEISETGVALAQPNNVYVIYLPQGGSAKVNLHTTTGLFEGHWFNPRNGRSSERFNVVAATGRQFDAPDTNDWVLLLKAP